MLLFCCTGIYFSLRFSLGNCKREVESLLFETLYFYTPKSMCYARKVYHPSLLLRVMIYFDHIKRLIRMFCQIIMYHLNQLFTGWRSDYQHLPGGKKDFKSVFSLTWPSHFYKSVNFRRPAEISMTGFFLQLYLLHFFLSLSSKGECVLTLWDLQF